MGEFQGGQPLPTTGGRAPELLNFFFLGGGFPSTDAYNAFHPNRGGATAFGGSRVFMSTPFNVN